MKLAITVFLPIDPGFLFAVKMIYLDRDNSLAFSPLLFNDQTMNFTQHGIRDNSTDGIYFSIKDNSGNWSASELLDDIPMSDVITYYTEDKIAFFAKTYRLTFYDTTEISEMIKNTLKNLLINN